MLGFADQTPQQREHWLGALELAEQDTLLLDFVASAASQLQRSTNHWKSQRQSTQVTLGPRS